MKNEETNWIAASPSDFGLLDFSFFLHVHRTFSNAKPFKYSVSGIMGMIGWSGDCA